MQAYRFRVEYQAVRNGPWFKCTEITWAQDAGEARANVLERYRHDYEARVTLIGESQ